ncbi:MAG: hypothetical protein KBA91_01990 [Candidatus Moranbacteria bacterium]|jgi:hypothetical protein|nr:hypothetical protein [Candidatus Moranbacteria bacterium]
MEPLSRSGWESSLSQSHSGVSFWDNVLVRVLFGGAVLAWMLCLGLLLYFIHQRETPIILHYNVYFGVDLLGIWWQAYILPLLGFFFLLGHVLLARRFYQRAERIASYLMLLSAAMLTFGLLVASIGIVFINY